MWVCMPQYIWDLGEWNCYFWDGLKVLTGITDVLAERPRRWFWSWGNKLSLWITVQFVLPLSPRNHSKRIWWEQILSPSSCVEGIAWVTGQGALPHNCLATPSVATSTLQDRGTPQSTSEFLLIIHIWCKDLYMLWGPFDSNLFPRFLSKGERPAAGGPCLKRWCVCLDLGRVLGSRDLNTVIA